MTEKIDTIVLGLGGMGSATLYQLARRGKKVLGIEQFTPAHDKGSSHGKSRIIRQAYFEGSMYVPLVLRAYELWYQLEDEIGEKLLTTTGGLMIGPQGSLVLVGSQKSAEDYGIAHKMLSSEEVNKKYPQITLPENYFALYEEKAGFISPERVIEVYLSQARKFGAELHFEEKVINWGITSVCERIPLGLVKVTTDKGIYEAENLVITAGSWSASLLRELALPVEVQRRVMHWFRPRNNADLFYPEKFPVCIGEVNQNLFYVLPIQDEQDGVKVAFHTKPRSVKSDKVYDPDTLKTEVDEEEIIEMQEYIKEYIPLLSGQHTGSVACMYTSTPSEDFIIEHYPGCQNVVIATGFSGHGFKFASVIGEVLSDLVTEGKSKYDLSGFSLDLY